MDDSGCAMLAVAVILFAVAMIVLAVLAACGVEVRV